MNIEKNYATEQIIISDVFKRLFVPCSQLYRILFVCNLKNQKSECVALMLPSGSLLCKKLTEKHNIRQNLRRNFLAVNLLDQNILAPKKGIGYEKSKIFG